ncbi:TRAP transporter large permease [Roseixanthobacter pseudopolyaromaticivorans]|uniref:TRAP transporter large permease n=1 Tax=Xanthobacteraceae TaxID=335928 RepID=UPI00372A20F1
MTMIAAEEDITGEAAMVGRSAYQIAALRLENGIGLVVDVVAATLVLVEVAILTTTVFCRYVLNQPVTWSDEVASLVFLWLGMLGSVGAIRRGEHMRLALFLGGLKPSTRAVVDLMATVCVATFLAMLVMPTLRLVEQDYAILSADLGIPAAYGVAAVATSVALMLLVTVLRTAGTIALPRFAAAVAATLLLVAMLLSVKPLLIGLGTYNLLIFFLVGVTVFIAIGVPIAFSFGLATLLYMVFCTRLPSSVIVGRMHEGMSSIILLTIPLFIFLGLLLECTGLAKRMVDFLALLFGRFRGGLGYVLLMAMYLVSGISGAKAADMAAVGPVLIPEMKRRGAPEGDLVALLATSAAMAETIPPSLVLIIIGSVTGVSISALFSGGLLPAALAALMLAIAVYVRFGQDTGDAAPRLDPRTVGWALLGALPGLVLPFLIRAAVLEGIATATEVATIGIVYIVIVSLVIYRHFPLARVVRALVATASMSGAILLIIALAGAMSWALTQSGFSRQLVAFLIHLPGGAAGFLAVSILLFIVLGSALEGIPAIVLFGPLLFPAARAIGINEVHYAMVVLLSMGFGLFAPPFGYGYYTACAIARVSPDKAMKNMIPYLGALAIAIALVAAFPWISTCFLGK